MSIPQMCHGSPRFIPNIPKRPQTIKPTHKGAKTTHSPSPLSACASNPRPPKQKEDNDRTHRPLLDAPARVVPGEVHSQVPRQPHGPAPERHLLDGG